MLIYRVVDRAVEVLLVHPGGPYWQKRDRGAWQIPKGLIANGETPETAARREAEEELGIRLHGVLAPLGTLRQAGGKWVDAFAIEQDIDTSRIASNTFTMECREEAAASGNSPKLIKRGGSRSRRRANGC